MTDNSADLRTVISNRLSHRELGSSLRESHSFLSLHADTTMTSSFLAIHSTDEHRMMKIPLLTPRFTFSFYFSDNIMTDVASKQQTTALFLSTIVTNTRRHTELTKKKKTDKRDGETCVVPENIQFKFSCSF